MPAAVVAAAAPPQFRGGAATSTTRPSRPTSRRSSSDPDKGPTFLRLAWHSSGDYSKQAQDGGSRGGTIRFKEELAHGGNAGLAKAVKWLEPVKKAHPGASYADIFTLAGVVAIKEANGPIVGWSSGRVDEPVSSVGPDGRLPNADMGSPAKTADRTASSTASRRPRDRRAERRRAGALLTRAATTGPTPTPTTLLALLLLLNVEWTPRDWDGPFRSVWKSNFRRPTPSA